MLFVHIHYKRIFVTNKICNNNIVTDRYNYIKPNTQYINCSCYAHSADDVVGRLVEGRVVVSRL